MAVPRVPHFLEYRSWGSIMRALCLGPCTSWNGGNGMWRRALLAGCLSLAAGPLLAQEPAPPEGQPKAAPAAPIKIGPKVPSLIKDQVVPAYRARDFRGVLAALRAPVANWSDGQVKAVDELLEQSQLPALSLVLAEARWDLLKFGNDERLPAPKGRELDLT